MDDHDALIRAAHGMIRNHGHEAETKAEQRADNLEPDSQDAARHWREVARVVRILCQEEPRSRQSAVLWTLTSRGY